LACPAGHHREKEANVKLEHLMDFKARLYSPVVSVGNIPSGTRLIYSAADGTFEGPELKGRVLPGGGDWPLADADGAMRLDIRVTLETDDGAFIYMQNQGIWRQDPSGDMYIMSAPRFETGDERYQWLNDFVYVAEATAEMLEEEGFVAEVNWSIFTVVNG
jgi:hypothetical protein